MRLGSRQIELTRRRIDAIREYARKHGNLDTLKAYAKKHGNLGNLKQLALAPRSVGRRVATAFVIALASAAIALFIATVPPLSRSVLKIDEALYDALFKSRPSESRYDGPVVIVAVDDTSIQRMVKAMHYRWPWPRDSWAMVVKWLEKCGAKVIVFDLLFEGPSDHQRYVGDDTALAKALDEAKVPIVIAEKVPVEGEAQFALPVERKPTFGAVNLLEGATVRTYPVETKGLPALAVQAVKKFPNAILPAWANDTFRLHYYGATRQSNGKTTFHHVPALEVVAAAQSDPPVMPEITPDLFRDRIVLIGATANAAFDIKSAPTAELFPGTEVQATAISNLLENRRVIVLGVATTFSIGFLGALLAAFGAVVPKSAPAKLVIAVAAISLVYLSGYLLFVRFRNIYWLPLAMPLIASVNATLAGLAWTYLVEDRQRRVLRKFLAQYVSPEVAEELDRRGEISLGGVRRQMTVMFTDIAGFTDVSETMEVEQLERFMNYYLSEMSAIVFGTNGTLDKYIGDAIMTFWNAPLDQPDHAALACRAALGMKRREGEVRQALVEIGAGKILTRIGINTGPMVVGNMGSLQKLNYTVLGDAVNLASRLEGANKIYGSQILVAQPTVDLVQNQFLFRQLDLLRVKGKKKPMAVYELVAEGAGDQQQQVLASKFTEAFVAYQKQAWDRAEATLVALVTAFPDDGPSSVLLKRVRGFRENPPPADWDGVHVAKDK
jgi:adenylate cyclase